MPSNDQFDVGEMNHKFCLGIDFILTTIYHCLLPDKLIVKTNVTVEQHLI